MNLNEIREGTLKETFDALEEAFEKTGIDYYVIGALARDVWYARGNKVSRLTKDVDFAVLVGSQEQYDAVKVFLKQHKNFMDTKRNSFVMLTPEGIQVDILPFGEIEIDEAITIAGQGLSTIHVTGFKEVYEKGTEQVEMETGHSFEVATLAAIVLLKLIAFDDRPERRMKDARDIADIIKHYFDLQPDLVYGHEDLFADENDKRTMDQVTAVVLGREIRKIAESNASLLNRLIDILEGHITGAEDSAFVRNMVAETKWTVEQAVGYLENIISALKD